MNQTTPRPWKTLLIGDEDLGFILSIHDSNGKNFANMKLFGTKEECEANANLIFKAVNNYDDLIEVAKDCNQLLKDRLVTDSNTYIFNKELSKKINKVLSKVESE